MIAPRADEEAVDRYVDDQLPFAENPSIDPATQSRWHCSRLATTTPIPARRPRRSLDTVDAAGIERIAEERFGTAGLVVLVQR